ncbi:hypothetical protein [Aquimarina muelleri]|uniref:3-hydroxymyristoyl/3-hydroxydecanoyl-(Acyl carrier protein) dehydratase n=1 Tax=Aquimarina muelleri TaxID=279356 RepID=A0A918JZA2_9FLAO|nr:hypothetical protein [Aquimarina muelleri]MCX2761995.1 hypothetical protein [Aquimarina muelleri]GGX25112.1 hypothetical protein GCM10007384_27790 [Aquimarina muelleri]
MKINLPLTDIKHLIPQKKPFEMVSALLEFSETRVVSSLEITEENIFLKDNFFLEPGLIENMAQTVALHTGYDYFIKEEPVPIGYIGSIKKIDIFSLPKLKETIITKAEILHEFMGITMVKIEVFNIKKEKIASGEMKTVIPR